jgi:hypothetical protein
MPQVPTTPGEVQRRRVRQREMAQPDQILIPMTEEQMKEMTAEQLLVWIGSAAFGRIFASKDSVDKDGNVTIEGPFGCYLRKVALIIAETAAGSTCLLKVMTRPVGAIGGAWHWANSVATAEQKVPRQGKVYLCLSDWAEKFEEDEHGEPEADQADDHKDEEGGAWNVSDSQAILKRLQLRYTFCPTSKADFNAHWAPLARSTTTNTLTLALTQYRLANTHTNHTRARPTAAPGVDR